MNDKPKTERLPIEEHIPSEVFHAMGLLVSAASSVEAMTAELILRMIGTNRSSAFHAYPLIAGAELKTKIHLIRVFTALFHLPNHKEINKILDRIDALVGVRNEIAHSIMLPGRKKGQVILVGKFSSAISVPLAFAPS